MKKVQFLALALALVSTVSQARSLHPDTFRDQVAPVIKPINVTSVAATGEVVKTNHRRPFSNFLIAIPVMIDPGSACTAFVGQQVTGEKTKLQTITALGASNPLMDACIAVMPQPIKTQITFNMSVLTGGFVPAQPIQRQVIQIMPLGLHEVTLDMGNNSVTVKLLQRHHR